MFSDFLLEDLYNKHESKISFDLSSASPEALSINDLLGFFDTEKQAHILEELLKLKLSYSEALGSLESRKTIIEKLYSKSKAKILPANLLISSGASEAIFLVFNTLFENGDSIIVQKPIYQSLYQIALNRGIQVVDWDYELRQDADSNISQLEDLVKKYPHAKALVINNPNNPLGIGFDRDQLKRISAVIGERLLIADEVSRAISLKEIPSILELHTNCICIGDLSKAYALAGLRLGWIVANDTMLINRFSAQKNYLSLRSCSLSELLSKYALEVSDQISFKIRESISKNLDFIFSIAEINDSKVFFECDFAKESIIGHTILPRLLVKETWIDQLFETKQTFVLKGNVFGDKYQNRVRIGLAKDFKNLKYSVIDFLVQKP